MGVRFPLGLPSKKHPHRECFLFIRNCCNFCKTDNAPGDRHARGCIAVRTGAWKGVLSFGVIVDDLRFSRAGDPATEPRIAAQGGLQGVDRRPDLADEDGRRSLVRRDIEQLRTRLLCSLYSMFPPKVLALGRFAPEDLSVTIGPSNRMIDPVVEPQLETVWEAKVALAERQNKRIYNGLTYRLNNFLQDGGTLRLDLAIFEYKGHSLIEIPAYFDLSEPHYRKGCFTGATVKTEDDRYLMVELSGRSMNQNTIDLLGGLMETPPELKTGQDVFASLYKELAEEALVEESDIAEAYLRAMYLERRTNIGFYFEVRLKITADEVLKRFAERGRDLDIKSIKSLTRAEYLETLRKHNTNKQLIADLLSI